MPSQIKNIETIFHAHLFLRLPSPRHLTFKFISLAKVFVLTFCLDSKVAEIFAANPFMFSFVKFLDLFLFYFRLEF